MKLIFTKKLRYICIVMVVISLITISLSGCRNNEASESGSVVQSKKPSDTQADKSSDISNTQEENSEDNAEEFGHDVVAKVNGEDIKVSDLGYYIYNNAIIMMYKTNSETTEDISTFDWDGTNVDGKLLSDVVIESAIDDAINDVVFRQMAEKSGYSVPDDRKKAESAINDALDRQGETRFNIASNLIGIRDKESYINVFTNVSVFEGVAAEFSKTPEKYVADISVLNQYTGTKGATVQHVLILNDTDKGDPNEIAQMVYSKAKLGTDFYELMKQYNEDYQETEDGYTFPEGEMVESFENAAFSLAIDEISEIVRSDYGFHIIKRLCGAYELQNFWRSEADVIVSKNAKNIVRFNDVLNLISNAKSAEVLD